MDCGLTIETGRHGVMGCSAVIAITVSIAAINGIGSGRGSRVDTLNSRSSETYRWYSCQRCCLNLFVPSRVNRSFWLALGLRKCLRAFPFAASVQSVRTGRRGRSTVARGDCPVAALIAGLRDRRQHLGGEAISIGTRLLDVGPIEFPGCGDLMAIGRSGLRARHQPGNGSNHCEAVSKSARSREKLIESGHDRIGIIDTAAPCAAADRLQRRPEPGVVGQVGIGRELGMRRSVGQHASALFGAELDSVGTDKIERPFQLDPVDNDPDHIAVAQLADRSAGQGLGADVSDAGARGNAGESRIGQDRHVLAERQDTAEPP